MGLSASKGSRSEKISQRTMPKEKMSDLFVKICFEMNSGAMYLIVAIDVVL